MTSLADLEAVVRRELAAAVLVVDPSDTAALIAIRRRILDQAQARRGAWGLLKPCGTPAAHRRHLRHGGKPRSGRRVPRARRGRRPEARREGARAGPLT